MVALAKAGYNVTALSVDLDEVQTPNLNYILMEGVYEEVQKIFLSVDPEKFQAKSVLQGMKMLTEYFVLLFKIITKTKGFQQLMNYPDDFKFDLILFEYTGLPDILGFAHKFNYPPVIGISPFMTPPNTYDILGNPHIPSLIPYYSTDFSGRMNFWERSLNLFYYVMDYINRRNTLVLLDIMAKNVFGKDLPFIGDLEKKIDLVLVNSHSGMDLPELLLPNVIQVGGLQVKEPKPLAENINKFFNSAKKGAVYFSLGTNVRCNMIGEEKVQMFVKALAKFPDFHFLWKIDRTDLKVSKNVMVTQWAPQNDILGHPKTILFMSHCGLLSTQEATWHGVPLLAIPFFADQFTNAKKSVDAGVAEQILITSVTEEEIIHKLTQMLSKPRYHEKMKLRSMRFRDRMIPPLEKALWWCEYTIRHKGTSHLRSEARDMSPMALFMWDILLFWLGLFVAITGLFVYIIKRMCSANEERVQYSECLKISKKD